MVPQTGLCGHSTVALETHAGPSASYRQADLGRFEKATGNQGAGGVRPTPTTGDRRLRLRPDSAQRTQASAYRTVRTYRADHKAVAQPEPMRRPRVFLSDNDLRAFPVAVIIQHPTPETHSANLLLLRNGPECRVSYATKSIR
jgi:hypothetical protein